MKALEILENLKEYIETESRVGDLDYSHYSVMIDYVSESIEELEALENRSCEGCKYAKLAKDSSMKEIPNNISTCYHDFKCKRYYTDKWESK